MTPIPHQWHSTVDGIMTKEAKGSNPGYSTIMILTLGKLFMQLTSMQYIYTGEIVTELHGW